MIGDVRSNLRLALHGGDAAVQSPQPHFVWPVLEAYHEGEVLAQMRRSISIYDRSDIFAEFETAFAAEHSARFSLLTNSGTTALYSIYFALNLEPGDNIVVPDYTFFATVTPLLSFPVDIRFCDCDESGNLDPVALAKLLDKKTRAVVVTHMWGVPASMDLIGDLCRAAGVALIEDCSHAHGARFRDQIVGSFGAAAAWSLQGQKLVTGGEGGILVTNADGMFFDSLLLGHYNRRCRDEVQRDYATYQLWETGFGLKLRAHPLAVALAMATYRALPTTLLFRRQGAADLLGALRRYPFLALPDTSDRAASWYAFVFRFDPKGTTGIEPSRFVEAIRAEGATAVERPGATRDCSAFPVFRDWQDKRIRASSSNVRDGRPTAASFQQRAVKVTMPSNAADGVVFEQYVRAIQKVCDHIVGGHQL